MSGSRLAQLDDDDDMQKQLAGTEQRAREEVRPALPHTRTHARTILDSVKKARPAHRDSQ